MTEQPPNSQPQADAATQPPANSAPRELAPRANLTTPENPWPLRLLNDKINEYVSRMSQVWVEGQIVQYNRRPGAGMAFLTLRDTDTDSSINVSIYASVLKSLNLEPQEGARVVIHAKPTYWTKRGTLQLQADDIRLVGVGDLLARIDQLRRTLAAEGLFDAERKRPLPFLPRRVGLICGRAAKAKDDVIVNATARWPGLPFEIREVAVQGIHAVKEVTAALQELDANPQVDVIVISRGGGAVEDLLPFSDETLVRAAAACTTPLVSAIGHETDCPLLDLVADYRASTPTDAARRITPDMAEETAGLDGARERLRSSLSARLEREQQALTQIRQRPVLADPTTVVSTRVEEIGQLSERARRATSNQLNLAQAELRAEHAKLTALSPQGVLDRGYAILRKPGGAVILSSADIKKGDLIEGILAQGRMVAQVVGSTPATAPAAPADVKE